MEALQIITQPIKRQLVIDFPPSFSSDRRYEVIVLPMISEESVTQARQRKPSPKLAGTVHPLDDLTAPSTPESDWQLSSTS